MRGRSRKYIAAAPDGRLVDVLKQSGRNRDGEDRYARHVAAAFFKVLVLDEPRREWVETRDIGGAALLVGVNSSLCVPAAGWVSAGCVYYADDEIGKASLRLDSDHPDTRGGAMYRSSVEEDRRGYYDLQDIGVFSLMDGTLDKVQGLPKHKCWPPPAWFMPSV